MSSTWGPTRGSLFLEARKWKWGAKLSTRVRSSHRCIQWSVAGGTRGVAGRDGGAPHQPERPLSPSFVHKEQLEEEEELLHLQMGQKGLRSA